MRSSNNRSDDEETNSTAVTENKDAIADTNGTKREKSNEQKKLSQERTLHQGDDKSDACYTAAMLEGMKNIDCRTAEKNSPNINDATQRIHSSSESLLQS